MTVCISVDAAEEALLITDCLVTFEGSKEHMTPASAGFSHTSAATPQAALLGKFARIDGDSAVGFAGSAERIQDFFGNFRNYYRHALPGERPMRVASGLINDFNIDVSSPYDEISMIGFHARHKDQDCELHWIRRENTPTVETNFGQCAAIGSGADAILDELRGFDEAYWQETTAENSNLRLAAAVGALNTHMLLDPSKDRVRNTWGGYYQMTGYNWRHKRWFTTPDWAHLAYFIDISESEPVAHMCNKVIGYRGGYSVSHLLVGCRLDQELKTIGWAIPSGLGLDRDNDEERFDVSTFSPRLATVRFFIKKGDRKWTRTTTLNGDLVNNLTFRCTNNGIDAVGLSNDYLKFIVNEERAFGTTPTA